MGRSYHRKKASVNSRSLHRTRSTSSLQISVGVARVSIASIRVCCAEIKWLRGEVCERFFAEGRWLYASDKAVTGCDRFGAWPAIGAMGMPNVCSASLAIGPCNRATDLAADGSRAFLMLVAAVGVHVARSMDSGSTVLDHNTPGKGRTP